MKTPRVVALQFIYGAECILISNLQNIHRYRLLYLLVSVIILYTDIASDPSCWITVAPIVQHLAEDAMDDVVIDDAVALPYYNSIYSDSMTLTFGL